MIVSRCWPNDQRLGQRTGRHHFPIGIQLQPVMRDDRAFLGETFDMLRFLLHIAQRNEEREIGVLMPGRLEHGVERALHVFPDAVAPGLDHHAAAHVARLRHVGRADDLLIPFGKILRSTRADRGFWYVGFGHGEARYLNRRGTVDQPRFDGWHRVPLAHRLRESPETNATNGARLSFAQTANGSPKCAATYPLQPESGKKCDENDEGRNGLTPFWKRPRFRSAPRDTRFDTRHRRR